VAQVLFWKQRVKHFQPLFYKNKPVLPWYSVAPNLPLCPSSCSSPWSSGCCVPQPATCTEADGATCPGESLQASTGEGVGALLRTPPLPRIQAGNRPKMPPGGSAFSAQGASLGQVTQSTHLEKWCPSFRPSLSLGRKSERHEVASCCQWSCQAAVPLAGSVLEAWGADVGLVEGMRGVKHFWGRWSGRQDGAERFVGAQHRGEVLHLLRQLLDLPAQGSVLPLQVFALLRRHNHRGFLRAGAAGMSWGHWGTPRGSRSHAALPSAVSRPICFW